MRPRRLFNPGLQALLLVGLFVLTACSGPGLAPASAPAGQGTTAGSAASGAAVTLSFLVGQDQNTRDPANALVSAYTATHPNVTINIETRPTGTDGDNLVKTRLASGEMSDIFQYNSGSLLQALHPTETLVDISKEPFIENIDPAFLPVVSQNGQVFGVPFNTALGGGMLYNKKVYQQLGLSTPKSWAEFEANNDKIKAAGIAPVIASYGTSYTSQLFVLADYCNVQTQVPNFAQDYTANKAKYASTPVAMEGFTYLQEANQKGWYQQDYQTTTLDQALKLLVDGKGAHYPILTSVLANIAANYPNQVNDIGFFGQPGTDASKHCATAWMPSGTYIPKTTKHVAEAKDFLAFIASTAGVDAVKAKVPPQGPYMIKGTKLPDDALPAVKDLAAYVDSGRGIPALEFFSPVKGPNLEQICAAVGSGQMTPQQAADNYDKDVEKQAKQLGLPRLVVTMPDNAQGRAVSRAYPGWFYVPAALIYGLFFLVPTAFAFYFSLTRWSLFDAVFIGFQNYVDFLSDPQLVTGLRNTIIYAVVTCGLKILIALPLAVLLTSAIRLKTLFRGILFFPVLVSTVAVGITFAALMQPSTGLINLTLGAIGLPKPSWLGDPAIALYSVALVDVWKGIGIAMVIFIAGILAIPTECFEAARLEGGAWVKFRHVIVPLSRNATFTVILLSFIGGLRSFDLIWTMTHGGPGFASDVLTSVIFKEYQAGFYGLSTAGNVVLFILVTIIVYPLMRFFHSKELEA